MQKTVSERAERPVIVPAAAESPQKYSRPAAVLLIGWLVALFLAAAGLLRGAEIVTYSGPSINIPDDVPAGVEIPLNISGINGVIGDLDFSIDGDGPCFDGLPENKGIGHSWVGDLVITLTSPNGRTVTLLNQINGGQGGINFCHVILDDEADTSIQNSGTGNQPFFGTWKPASPLSRFDGISPNGVWTLRVADMSPGDTGTLHGFSLHIETLAENQDYAPTAFFNFDSSFTITNQSSFTGRIVAFDFEGEIDSVEYRVLPTSQWLSAAKSDSEENNWLFTANLAQGPNTIQARAIDNLEQSSPIVERTVTYDPNYLPPPSVELLNVGADNLEVSVSPGTSEKLIKVRGTALPLIDRVEWKPATQELWMVAEETGGGGSVLNAEFTVTLSPGTNTFQVRAVSSEQVFGPVTEFRVFRSTRNIVPVVVIEEPDGDRTIPLAQTSYDFKGSAFDPDGALTLVRFRVVPESYLTPEWSILLTDELWQPATNTAGDWSEWEFTAEDLEEGTSFVQVNGRDNDGDFSGTPARAITRADIVDETGLPKVTIQVPATDRTVPGDTDTILVSGIATIPQGKELEIVEIRSRGGRYSPTIDISPNGDYTSWERVVDLIEGEQLIEVRARTTDGIESLVASRKIIRETDPRPRPTVTIVNPATNLFIPNQPGTVAFNGTASDDAGVKRVEWRMAKNIALLGDWQLANNNSGDWTQWSFTASPSVFNNIVQVRAVDVHNLIGATATRTIFREAALPQLNVTFPGPGFVAFNREDSITVEGTASDADGVVTAVEFRFGENTTEGQPWLQATSVEPNFAKWSFKTELIVGVNAIDIRAKDNSGAYSAVTSLSITRQKPGIPMDLLVLTEFTDVWGSRNTVGTFTPPFRYEYIGFHHDPANGWKTIAGDFNGDGLTDLGTTTPFGDFWIALNGGGNQIIPPVKSAFGWAYNEQQGFGTFDGDFNGDGKTDLAMVTPDSMLYVGYNTEDKVPTPVLLGPTALRFLPAEGLFLYAADLTGDGKDDLIQIDNLMGTVFVAPSIEGGFGPATLWGTPGFKYDPNAGSAVHFGDFNGDNIEDIVQQDEEVWSKLTVALSTGSSLTEPRIWGGVGFSNNPNRGKGWWVFVFDATGDGLADLVQLNEFGEFWVSESTGRGQFLPPNKNAILGFEHKPNGPWQVYPADLKP